MHDRPTIGILDACRANRRVGETLYETALRLLTVEAMYCAGHEQKTAARILRATQTAVNNRCRDLQIRPIDRSKR